MSTCSRQTRSSTQHNATYQLRKRDIYGSSLCEDYSDRKATDALINKLFSSSEKNKKAQLQNSTQSGVKYKQLPMSNFCGKSTKNKVSPVSRPSTTERSVIKKSESKEIVENPGKSKTSQKISGFKENKKTKTTTSSTKLMDVTRKFSTNNSNSFENCTKENIEKKVMDKKHVLSESLNGSSLPCYNHSDRKQLQVLTDKILESSLKNKRARLQDSSPSSSKYKQLPMSNFCQKSSEGEVLSVSQLLTSVRSMTGKSESKKVADNPSKSKTPRNCSENRTLRRISNGRVDKKKNTDNSTKLTNMNEWLSRDNRKSNKSHIKAEKIENKANGKKCVGNESLNNNKIKSAVKKKTGLKRQLSGSFAKYGMSVPSFEDMLAYQKKLEEQKQCIESISSMEISEELLDFNFEEPEVSDINLDCRHLTIEEIKEAFDQNFQYVRDIFHGKKYSARHERFKNEDCKDQGTIKDLKYNTSMSTFTFEQKQQLLKQLRKEFNDDDDISANNQYYFKVLLPELCTKIFMDIHNMSFNEAVAYLETRPVRN